MKDFSTAICVSIISFGLIELVSPNSKFSKNFKRCISVIIVFLILVSIKNLANFDFNLPYLKESYEITFDDSFSEQFKSTTEGKIKDKAENLLKNNKINFKEVSVTAIQNSNFEITDFRIEIKIDKNGIFLQEKLKIQSLFKNEFNINVIVKEDI